MYSDAFFCIFLSLSIVEMTFQSECSDTTTNAKFPSPTFKGTYPSPVILNSTDFTFRAVNPGLITVQPNLFKGYKMANTGKGVIVTSSTGDTQATISGGILSSTYFFYAGVYRWNSSPKRSAATQYDRIITPLEVVIIWQKSTYKTFEEASQKPDGIVQARFPVTVNDITPNVLAVPFLTALASIQSAGKSVTVASGVEFLWALNTPVILNTYFMPGTLDPLFRRGSSNKQIRTIDIIISSLGFTAISTSQFKVFLNTKNYRNRTYSTQLKPNPIGCRPVGTGQPLVVVPAYVGPVSGAVSNLLQFG